ncbi:baseplate J/gp47 family protein [Ktedonobacter racemifer]|uniref:Baseplate protein J-like barrel domain-containing protein n=1 Tax=Ktedonobacter racemifer DSM 44963 TaxID=485913 RepID=D6TCZ7_KTERA|nr:baseplate J/gp47 family protein [Ktedonobacter racemifer]EFH90048.1 hypothetical protein Krac_11645 [Ktedonobacter racemifer DSM 44963]
MQDNIRNDLEQMLRELDQEQQQARTINGIPHIEANQEYDRERRLYDIEIHIYPKEGPEPEEPANTVESSLPIGQEPQPRGRKSLQWVRKRTRPLGLMACACALLIGYLLFAFPLWTATTTVTIVPVTRTIESRLIVTIGNADPADRQIPGRFLPTITMSQARTGATTGKTHQDAQAAHGSITFYNSATYAQMIPAGTLVTAANGIQAATDQDVTIGAASYPTFGQASVSAHAIVAGPAGNLKAGAIYGPCCRVNISAVNGAFRGGLDARDYQTVTQRDIDIVAEVLKTGLDQGTEAALQAQVQGSETLATPLHCQQRADPDHRPGEEATTIHVTLNETCTGIAYQTQPLHALLTQAINVQAVRQLGAGYAPNGDTQVTAKAQGTNRIQAIGTSRWVYQFTQAQQEQIKGTIAGKSQAQTKTLLLAQPGVQSVSFSGNTTLPDKQGIRFVIVTF